VKITPLLASLVLLGSLTAIPAADASTVPACTNPAVVHDGLIDLTCFPSVPVKQYPTGKAKCSHIDSWATGTVVTTVNGQKYTVTSKYREDIRICR
jgi:hypothetical protein